jgi:UDP-glucuronate decarboxylase
MHPHDGRVISNFIVQALKGDEITIYGDGSHTRSFCYVDDLIDGMIRLMRSPPDFIGPVNLGNPSEYTIRELAAAVLRLAGSRSKLSFKPLPSDDPMRRCPDITLAKARLDWKPAVPLEDGLKETIGYFRVLLQETP